VHRAGHKRPKNVARLSPWGFAWRLIRAKAPVSIQIATPQTVTVITPTSDSIRLPLTLKSTRCVGCHLLATLSPFPRHAALRV